MTLTRRPAIARGRSLDADTVAWGLFALLCLAVAVGFLVYPTYPNYDSYYSLLWGREVLDLQAPVFEGHRVPTEHPLAIAAGALLSLAGEGGDRLWIAATFASYLWLVWGVYRLGQVAFTPLVGGVAAALLLTRFDYAFLAARGYIDVPYMALVVWAAVLEARRPRRPASLRSSPAALSRASPSPPASPRPSPRAVLLLLAAAGMLRPEAWVLAGLYWLWVARRAPWRRGLTYAGLAALGPLVWMAVDLAVTGNPLFSLLYTSGSAEDLGRQRPLGELPLAVPEFFASLVKLPVLLAAVAGFGIALVLTPRRLVMPLLLLVTGIGTFVLIGLAGASVIERYLAVAALALLVFAAVFLGGFTMLERGRLRTAWMGLSAAVVVLGVIFTATHVRLSAFDAELSFRGAAHDDLAAVLRSPGVQAGLRCGPLLLPNHKLVPDSRWILDAPFGRAIPRSDPAAPRPRRGVALVVTSRFAVFKHAWSTEGDPPLIQVPPAGFARVATSDFYAAYARC